jgi:hypothetical protein
MAMPTLAAMASTLAAGYRGHPDDIDSEVLAGFLEALRHGVEPNRAASYARLCLPRGALAGSPGPAETSAGR